MYAEPQLSFNKLLKVAKLSVGLKYLNAAGEDFVHTYSH